MLAFKNSGVAVATPGIKTQKHYRPASACLQRLGCVYFTTGTRRHHYRDAAVSDSLMKSIGVLPSRRLNMVENALGLS